MDLEVVFRHFLREAFEEGDHSWKCLKKNGVQCTPLNTNMELENTFLEKEKHLQTTNFGVPAVNFRGCTFLKGICSSRYVGPQPKST